MKKLLPLAAMLACALVGRAQMLTFYGNNVVDSSNNKVASGTLTVTPVSAPNGRPISYRKGGGGQVVMQPVTAVVTNGAFSMQLPDVAQTYPANVCFAVTAVDNNTGVTLYSGGYGCVQPSMTASYSTTWCGSAYSGCDFDLYPTQDANIAPLQTTGSISYNYNSQQVIDLDGFPGAEYGAKLCAADAAYTGQPATFGIVTAGTMSTPCTLSSQHSLVIYAPITFTGAGTITPTTYNTVSCSGSGEILDQRTFTNDATTASILTAGPGAAEVQWLDVHDCRFEGIGVSANSYLFLSIGPSAHIKLLGNKVHNGQLFSQSSALPNTSQDLLVTGNEDVWDQSGGYSADVLIYGAYLNVNVSTNNFVGGATGAQFYCKDGSYFPPQADIVACGLRNVLFSNNTCENMGETCGWGSMMYRTRFDANTVTTCGDVCIDLEASADTVGSNNTITGGANGDLTEYYVGYDNSFVGNKIVSQGENGISIRNSNADNPANQSNLSILNNTFTCVSNGNPCEGTVLYTEASQGVSFIGNQITNGQIAYSVAFFSRPVFTGNQFQFTVPVVPINGGGVFNGYAAIPVPDWHDQTSAIVANNLITSTVTQNVPCISAGMSAAVTETVYVTNNTCIGSWTAAASVSNSNGNAAVPQNFVFHGNVFPTSSIITGASNAPVNVVTGGNWAGAGATAF